VKKEVSPTKIVKCSESHQPLEAKFVSELKNFQESKQIICSSSHANGFIHILTPQVKPKNVGEFKLISENPFDKQIIKTNFL
jgi:hypothetical protein